MSTVFTDWNAMPGPSAVRDTAEANFLWNKGAFAAFDYGAVLDGASRDAGGSPTTILRTGLLLGKVTSSGKCKQWSGTATDGTQYVYGIDAVTFNNAAASSVAYATSGHIIGGIFKVYSNPAGTLWLTETIGQSATLTVA